MSALAYWLNTGVLKRWRCPMVIVGLLLVLGALLLAQGCGGSAIQRHANAAMITGHTLEVAGQAASLARADALDRVTAESEGQPPEARRAALRREHEQWQPVAEAHDAVRAALRSWVSAISLAHARDSGDEDNRYLVSLALRVATLWDPMSALLRRLGVEVPALPEDMASMLESLGGDR